MKATVLELVRVLGKPTGLEEKEQVL